MQNGWVRANERKLDAAKSTALEPVLSLRAADVQPMPADQFGQVTVPLYYQGHVYRAGSRIRVTISAPERRPADLVVRRDRAGGTADVSLALTRMPSRLVLPDGPGRDVPTGLPPCPGLRGEPCRDYLPFTNR